MPRSSRSRNFTFEDVEAWFAEFQNESDRSAVVLAVAFLDAQLEEILRAFCADEKELAELAAPDQPLGSLAARRRLCLSLGLISLDEASELRILGKIRNEFAHKLHGLSLDTAPVVDLVQNLAIPQRVFPNHRSAGRPRFTICIGFMHLLLNWRLQAAKATKRAKAVQAEVPLTKLDQPPEAFLRRTSPE